MSYHTRRSSSIDDDMSSLDIEGGSGVRLEQSYFQGLSLPQLSSWLGEDEQANSWTAAGPMGSSVGGAGSVGLGGMMGTAGLLGSVRLHAIWASNGWRDALKFREMGSIVTGSPHIRKTIIKGLSLSLSVCLGIFFLEMIYVPTHLFFDEEDEHHEHHVQTWADADEVLWLYPVVAVCYFIASSWTVDVAKTASKLKHGRGMSVSAAISGVTSESFRSRVFTESFRLFVVLNYVFLGTLLQQIPWIGRTLCFLMVSFVDAYYCFDPVMISRGWSVERRLRFVETKWAYMTAFGIVPTVISYFHPSGLLNLFLFMAIYPFYVVLALLARPEPRSIPGGSTLTPLSSTHDKFTGTADVPAGTTLSSLFPARIPIFMPTVVLYRLVMQFAPRGPQDIFGPTTTGYGGEKSPAYASSFEPADGGRRTAAQFVGEAWAGGGTSAFTGRFGSTQPIWGGNGSAWNQHGQPPPPPPYPYGSADGHAVQTGPGYEQAGEYYNPHSQSAEVESHSSPPPTLAPPPMSNSGRHRSGMGANVAASSATPGLSSRTGVGQSRHVHYRDGEVVGSRTPESHSAFPLEEEIGRFHSTATHPPPPKVSTASAAVMAKGKKSD